MSIFFHENYLILLTDSLNKNQLKLQGRAMPNFFSLNSMHRLLGPI